MKAPNIAKATRRPITRPATAPRARPEGLRYGIGITDAAVATGGSVGVMVMVCTWPVMVCTVVTGVGDQVELDDDDDDEDEDDGESVVVLIKVVDWISVWGLTVWLEVLLEPPTVPLTDLSRAM